MMTKILVQFCNDQQSTVGLINSLFFLKLGVEDFQHTVL